MAGGRAISTASSPALHRMAVNKDVFQRVHRKFAALGIDVRDIGVNELVRIRL